MSNNTNINSADQHLAFLRGGGEMGALTRAYDWSQSVLGDPAQWPQSLKTTLGIILNSRFPMFLFWGPDSICFHNDAYRPSLGNDGKHPHALGKPASEVWPEIWKDIKPLIDNVLGGGEASWSEDQLLPIYRNGKLEDVYWTFSYSPVKDESGEPAGVFVTCTETTAAVVGLQKLETSNNRYLNNIMQAPVAMSVLRGPSMTVEVANDLMLEVWGKTAGDVMYKPLFVGLPEAKGQGFEELLDQVYRTGEKFVANGHLAQLPRNGVVVPTYLNFVYEPFREADGKITGIVATATEVTTEVEARQRVQESNDRLSFAIDAAELGTYDYDPHSGKFKANERLTEWFGLLNTPEIALSDAIAAIAARDRDRVSAAIQATLSYESGGQYDIEYHILPPGSKTERIVVAKGKTFFDENRVAYKLRGTVQDVTSERTIRSELEKSKQQLEFAIEATELGTFSYDPDRDEFTFNERLRKWFGLPLTGGIVLADAMEAIVERDRAPIKAALAKAFDPASGWDYNIEHTIIDPITQQERIVLGKGKSSFDEHGRLIQFIGTIQDVTDVVLAQKKVTQAKEQLEFALEAGELGAFDYNPASNTFNASERIRQWYGLPLTGEIVTADAMMSVPERDRGRVIAAMERVFEYSSGGHYDIEYSVVNPSTKMERVVRAKGKVWFDEDRKPVQFNGTIQDVTDQALARQKIEESEERFRIMAEGTDIMIAVSDETSGAIYFNQAWSDLTGRPMAELLHFGWADLVHPDDREGWLQVYLTAFEQRETFMGEFRLLHQDGIYRTVLAKGPPRFRADGTFAGYIASCIDITDRKAAETALRENEQKLRALVENAPFPIAVYVGREMIIELANQSMIDIWGKGNDVLNRSYNEVMAELADQLVHDQLQEVYTTGQAIHMKNQRLVLLMHGREQPFYFNYSLTPLLDASGKVYAVMNTGVDITDLSMAKLQIEESEQRFRNNVRQAPLGISIFRGPEYVVEMANDAYLQLVDRTAEQFIGSPLYDVLPEVRPAVEQLLHDVYHKGEPFFGTDFPVILNRYGREETAYFTFAYQPLREQDGEISGVMVVTTEVTEGAIAKQKMMESEQRFRKIADSAPVMIWMAGTDKLTHFFNTSWLKFTGRPMELELGNGWTEGIHPDDAQRCLDTYYTAFDSRDEFYMEYRMRRHDGEYRWISDKGVPRFTADGVFEGYIGACMDIHERTQIADSLKESEQKFRLLADSMPQYIWTADIGGHLNYYNQSVYDYSGLTAGQLAEGGWLQIVHPDDQPENIRVWTEAIKSGNDFIFEHRFRRYDGEYRWQLSRAIAQRDSQGNIQMWVGTSTDIQDQKMFTTELERQVHERTSELERKNIVLENMNAELKSFTYVSSHDLQEPLRKIQIYTDRLVTEEAERLSENGRGHFTRIQGAATRMRRLIDDLLSYSRVTNVHQAFEKTDLRRVVEDVIDDYREKLTEHHARIVIRDSCELMMIPFQFKQLFTNLISNSLKFAGDKKPVIEISCAFKKAATDAAPGLPSDRDYYEITYHDNGIGFSPEYKDKIFELFQRLHAHNQYEGTGIGLAIVKKIIENHGGTVSASGELGQGATFVIRIPVG